MPTFVLIIFFYEVARGYSITNIPGYRDRPSCEAAISEIQGRMPHTYTEPVLVCIMGPQQ